MPAEDPWYCCESCSVQAKDLAELDAEEEANEGEEGGHGSSDESVVMETVSHARVRLGSTDTNGSSVTMGSPRWNASMHPLSNPMDING